MPFTSTPSTTTGKRRYSAEHQETYQENGIRRRSTLEPVVLIESSPSSERLGVKRARLSTSNDSALHNTIGNAHTQVDTEMHVVSPAETSTTRSGRASSVAPASEAEMGVIESVDMTDFMCHRRLTIRLGPRVNFIVGNNGSGKSAILTAIVICLGAKATFTQRANNLRSLIREGANAAEIVVRLKNQGEDAYRPDLYGKTICIERRILRDGTSTYRLRNGETNAVISTKREELMAICDHMGIQLDNPMNVLSQETAKAFLSSSKPEDKYEFFSRGTQLTQLSEEYAMIRASLRQTKQLIESKRQALPDLQRALHEAELRLRDMQQAEEMERKLDRIKNEMAWAQVVEVEQKLQQAEARVEKAGQRIPAVKKKLEKATKERDLLAERIRSLDEEIQKEQDRKLPMRQEIERLAAELRTKKERIAEYNAEEREMNVNIRRLRADIDDYQRRIDEVTAKLNQDHRTLHQRINREINETNERIQQHKQDMDRHQEKEVELGRRITALRRTLHELDEQRDQVRRDIDSVRKLIAQLREQQQDRTKAFGSMMPDVLRAIRKEERWHEMPIGPIGNYIKVKDPIWTNTLESLIGQTLSSFIVTNHADKARLIDILKRFRCFHSRIIVLKPDPNFDYSSGEPDERFLTVLRVLEISHPMIVRQLVIHNHIEKIVLIKDRQEAEREMKDGYPHNVIACYSANGFGVGSKTGGMATTALKEYRGPPRLAIDIASNIRSHEQQLQQYLEQRRRLDEQRKQTTSEIQDCEDLRNKEQLAYSSSQKKVYEEKLRLEQLKDQLQDDEPANLGALEEEKARAQHDIEMIKQQFSQLAVEKRRALAEQTELQEKIEEQKQLMNVINDRINELKMQRDELTNERLRHEGRVQHWSKVHEEELQRVAAASAQLDERRQAVETAIQKARLYCPERVQVSKTPAELDREIHQIQLRLREAERNMGCTLDEVLNDVNTKRSAYIRAKREVEQIDAEREMLHNSLAVRVKRLEAYRHMVAKRARHNFLWNLAQRGYSGKLEFDHKNRRLTPRVQTDEHVQDHAAEKDPRSLSGGEKSFSTICLLLALWESMGCPIRGLDEYDVFMDAVNRSISTRMLIDCARLSRRTQFVLITPQSMDNIQLGPDVHVQRLKDPERNQTTLPM